MLQDSEYESDVLGGEDQKESGAGCRGTEATGGDGVALHHGLGVRTEAESARTDAEVAGVYAEQNMAGGSFCQKALPDVGGRGRNVDGSRKQY